MLFYERIIAQFESRAIETEMLVVAMIVLIASATDRLTFPRKYHASPGSRSASGFHRQHYG